MSDPFDETMLRVRARARAARAFVLAPGAQSMREGAVAPRARRHRKASDG